MANELLQRFINEEMDSSLYSFYLEHPITIHNEFMKFYKKQEKSNEYFAKILKTHHFIKTKDKILETILSPDIDGITDFLKQGEKLICRYGTVKKPNDTLPPIETNTCYLTNGFYENTEAIVKKMIHYVYGLDKPSFIVGVVDQPVFQTIDGKRVRINTKFFEENVARIKKLQKELHSYHFPVSVYQENNKYNVYMLIHRGDRR